MFVTRGKYNQLAALLEAERVRNVNILMDLDAIQRKLRHIEMLTIQVQHERRQLDQALSNANDTITALRRVTTSNTFTQDEIQTLIRLCHPDRHQGATNQTATRMTQRLLAMRK